MISNIGCTEQSAHSGNINSLPRGLRRVFNMKTYEIEFPLKHAKYVIGDEKYEKERNKIMGYNTPFISFLRKCEKIIIMLLEGKLIDKIFNKIQGSKYEK